MNQIKSFHKSAIMPKNKRSKMTLVIENANENLKKAIKAIVKLSDAKATIKQTSKTPLHKAPSWLKEAKDMQKNPKNYKTYTDIDTMFKDILR